jgi:hypothetical protein
MLADLNRLFDACFRIQAEASVAAGHHIPMVIENVRGAQKWIGRARWNFGSYYLWGDVPALMPFARGAKVPGFRFDGNGSFQSSSVREAHKSSGMDGRKVPEHLNQRAGHPHTRHITSPDEHDVKCAISRLASSKSSARKAASALIAKIPLQLARHIAAVYRPHAAVQ